MELHHCFREVRAWDCLTQTSRSVNNLLRGCILQKTSSFPGQRRTQVLCSTAFGFAPQKGKEKSAAFRCTTKSHPIDTKAAGMSLHSVGQAVSITKKSRPLLTLCPYLNSLQYDRHPHTSLSFHSIQQHSPLVNSQHAKKPALGRAFLLSSNRHRMPLGKGEITLAVETDLPDIQNAPSA